MRPRIPNLEERLLVAAAEIVASQGVGALSLRELGRRAGVSRATPYSYFSDKADLMARVGSLGFTRLRIQITESIATAAHPLERLREGLRAYVRFAMQEGPFFYLMFSGDLQRSAPAGELEADTSRFAFSSPAAQQAFGVLVEGVRSAQASGDLAPGEDPLLVVNVLWAFTHGVAVLARGDHLKHPEGRDAVFEAGLAALLARYRPAQTPSGVAERA